MVKRTASVACLGLFFRSRYKASCFRRNRFSAASAPRERSPVLNTVSTSDNTRSEVRKNSTSWGRFSMAAKYYVLKRLIFVSDRIFAEHRPLAQPPRYFGRPSPPTYAILPPAPKSDFLFFVRAIFKGPESAPRQHGGENEHAEHRSQKLRRGSRRENWKRRRLESGSPSRGLSSCGEEFRRKGRWALGGEQAGPLVLPDDEHLTGDCVRTGLPFARVFLEAAATSLANLGSLSERRLRSSPPRP
jgi:hypothetical protein